MARKLADDLPGTNAEFEKRKSDRVDDETPRESPNRQAAEVRGLRRPDFSQWTTDELRDAAGTLEIDGAESLDRKTLIERLNAADPDR